MERLKRYEKQIVAIISTFVVLFGGVFSTSFQSNAIGQSSSLTFYVNYPQPYCSETKGYISLVYYHAQSSQYRLNTLFWSIEPDFDTNNGTDRTTLMDITITGNRVVLQPWCEGGYYYYSLFEYSSQDFISLNQSGYYPPIASAPKFDYTYENLVGVVFGGNVGTCNMNGGYYSTPTIHWANSPDANELYYRLNIIWSHLEQIDGDTTEIVNKLLDIYNQNVDINIKLDELKALHEQLIEEQQESNTWLEKIWNSIQEFFNPSEEEKTDSEQFDSETSEKSDEIGGLIEESTTNKPDVDEMSNSIDSNLDMTSANEYGAVLLNITENEYILQMLLIVVTVAIIAYVLFGKR